MIINYRQKTWFVIVIVIDNFRVHSKDYDILKAYGLLYLASRFHTHSNEIETASDDNKRRRQQISG